MGGMSKQGVSHWEKERYEPNLAQLVKLCEVLDCSLDWLVLGKEAETLPADALEQAKFFNRLSAEGKKKWRALRPVFADAVPDKHVEQRMPVTTRPKEPHK
jgi:transcriptional regulator with XRE-family HTH domain